MMRMILNRIVFGTPFSFAPLPLDDPCHPPEKEL